MCTRACVFMRPVSHDAREVGFLVVIHSSVALPDEAALHSEGADHARPQQRLVEVRVHRRAAHRLQTLQLARRGHVETLKHTGIDISTHLILFTKITISAFTLKNLYLGKESTHHH